MILAITESAVPLSVRTLGNLLIARSKREREALYQAELLHLLVKTHYKEVKSPIDVAREIWKQPTRDKPVKQIVGDIIRKLGR